MSYDGGDGCGWRRATASCRQGERGLTYEHATGTNARMATERERRRLIGGAAAVAALSSPYSDDDDEESEESVDEDCDDMVQEQ